MSEEEEVPWPPGQTLAKLNWSSEELGYLHFIDPNGERAAVPVTRGESFMMRTSDDSPGSNVWHIDVEDDLATVSPSVHYIGRWHSPNPVQFKLVDRLEVDW